MVRVYGYRYTGDDWISNSNCGSSCSTFVNTNSTTTTPPITPNTSNFTNTNPNNTNITDITNAPTKNDHGSTNIDTTKNDNGSTNIDTTKNDKTLKDNDDNEKTNDKAVDNTIITDIAQVKNLHSKFNWAALQGKLKSGFKAGDIYIKWENRSNEKLEVYWVGYSGDVFLYYTLESTKSYKQHTYRTHPWLVKTDNGRYIA